MPLEELALPGRQGVHVGEQEAVVLGVEKHLASLAEVLGLAWRKPEPIAPRARNFSTRSIGKWLTSLGSRPSATTARFSRVTTTRCPRTSPDPDAPFSG
jgi:hypothetical protein